MDKKNNRRKKTLPPQVTIIGAGEIGRAINHILSKKGIETNVWDRDPKKNLCQLPLEDTLPKADIVFLCIPSWCLVEALTQLQPLMKRKTVVVSVAKGIEQKTGRTMDELLEKSLVKGQPFALLAGPMLAEEIMQNLGAAAVAASKSPRARKMLCDLFQDSDLRITASTDLAGIALASVLKNVYAIGLGISDGLNWGGNRKGWLAGRSAKEMSLILKEQGVNSATACSAAGFGDLIATGFSNYSSNHETGSEIVKTRNITGHSEGAISLAPLIKRLGTKHRKYPLLVALTNILIRRQDPHKIFERYFHA